MKRRLAVLAAVAALSGAFAAVSPAPSQAAVTAVSGGLGAATLSAPGVFYPVTPGSVTGSTLTIAPASATFTFHFSTGATVFIPGGTVASGISATGHVDGWCGLSGGRGTVTGTGEAFVWAGVGSFLIVTGKVTGLVNATPNVPGGESCVTGADNFIVTGAGFATNNAGASVSVSIPKTSQSVSVLTVAHARVHNPPVHAQTHLP